MSQTCTACGKSTLPDTPLPPGDITPPLCAACLLQLSAGNTPTAWLEAIATPVLLMQGQPRQVITANRRGLALFGKELSEVAGHRGGQVFNCLHSFSEAGCGLDSNCQDCKIKGAIVDTFTTNTAHQAVATTLPIQSKGGTEPYHVQISTQKIGELALVRVERFDKQ